MFTKAKNVTISNIKIINNTRTKDDYPNTILFLFLNMSSIIMENCLIEGNTANTIFAIIATDNNNISNVICRWNLGGCLYFEALNGKFNLDRLLVEYNAEYDVKRLKYDRIFDYSPLSFEGANTDIHDLKNSTIKNSIFRHNYFKGLLGGAISLSRSSFLFLDIENVTFYNNT